MAHSIPDDTLATLAWQNTGVSTIQWIWYFESALHNPK